MLEHINAVIAQIDALPDKPTKADVEAARVAYESLTDDEIEVAKAAYESLTDGQEVLCARADI